MYLVGIDCAAQDKDFGLALGQYAGDRTKILEVILHPKSVVRELAAWMAEHHPTILAFDAPLGWPQPLGRALVEHRAGEHLQPTSDELFHRVTDRFVKSKVRKRALEVGADKIARAAAHSLRILHELRRTTGVTLPLGWQPGMPTEPVAIEVYPAATLRAHGLSEVGYKGIEPKHLGRRLELAQELKRSLDIAVPDEDLIRTDDGMDGVICVLAAEDFLRAKVCMPEDLEVAKHEGWIWFGDPVSCRPQH